MAKANRKALIERILTMTPFIVHKPKYKVGWRRGQNGVAGVKKYDKR